MRYVSSGRCVIRFAQIVALLGVAISARAADRSWINNAGGAFTTAANWSGSLVAGPTDRAIFSIAGATSYTVTFPASVATDKLLIDDLVTFDLQTRSYLINSTDTSQSIVIGSGITSTANALTVQAGTLSTAGGMSIADVAGSLGSLVVSTGGVVDVTPTFVSAIGQRGNGTLSITGGGSFSSLSTILGNFSTGVGTAIVDGVGSGFNAVGSFVVGGSGAGTFTLRNSATATFGSNAIVGFGAGGSGTLLIGPSGSSGGTLTGTGTLIIGQSGTGLARIENGLLSSGTLSLGLLVGSSGAVEVGGGTCTATRLTVGSAGTGQILVGDDFSIARFIVSGTGTNNFGSLAAGQGTLRIFNNGTAAMGAGTTIFGNAGVGTLEVLADGAYGSTGTLIFGQAALSRGFGRIDGGGATLSCGSLFVGNSGVGELQILNGADVTSGTAFIAAASEGVGTVIVSGSGSSWTSSGGIFVGASGVVGGSALLDINPGATVTSAGSILISLSGQVDLDGGTLSVGSFNGLASGGVFNFNSGTLIISGASGQSLVTGGALDATYVAEPDKTVRVTNTLTITTEGLLAMHGGRVQAGSLLNGGQLVLGGIGSRLIAPVRNQSLLTGDGRIEGNVTNIAGGEIRADSGDTIRIVGSLDNSGQITLVSGSLDVTGAGTNQATGRITGRGLLRSAGLTNAGTIALSVGPSDVFGALTNTATGKTIVTGNSTSVFYDDVTNQAGSEFRVSTGSTAVFFGSVTGLAAFTGTGTTIFEGPASLGPLAAGTSVVEAFGLLSASSVRQAGLIVYGDAEIVPNGTTAATSKVQQFLIAGSTDAWTGRLDLNDNDLAIDYTGLSPLASVRNQIKTAYTNGAWTGNGIATSLGDATHGLGYADNTSLALTTFSGQPVDSTSVLVKYTYYGDANLDGQVDISDLARLATAWQTAGEWVNGDFDYSGFIDISDLARLATNWQAGVDATSSPQVGAPLATSFEQALASVGLGGVSVPEPLAAGAIGIAMAALRYPRNRDRALAKRRASR